MSVGQPGPICTRCNQIKELFLWTCLTCGQYWACADCADKDGQEHDAEGEVASMIRLIRNPFSIAPGYCPFCARSSRPILRWDCSTCGYYWACWPCMNEDHNRHKGKVTAFNSRSWKNDFDKAKWQPLLANGEGLWITKPYSGHARPERRWHIEKPTWVIADPVLYGSRQRAERIARREERRREKKRLKKEEEEKRAFKPIHPPLQESKNHVEKMLDDVLEIPEVPEIPDLQRRKSRIPKDNQTWESRISRRGGGRAEK